MEVYLKDESAHPTGSVKHRLVRAMFRRAIASGRITADTTVVAVTGATSRGCSTFRSAPSYPRRPRRTPWAECGEPTIADEIFEQLRAEPHPVPAWIVTGAGTCQPRSTW
ncbi:hypothetical protein AB4Z54_25100, partial [Streptomyces sp. MCAF7]